MRLTLSELADAVGGTLQGPDRSVDGATIDSRQCGPGQLFVAIVADRDGHDFVAAAADAGADAALVNRAWFETAAPRPDGLSLVVAGDTSSALLDAGRLARARSKADVIGLTGSVGKTSTKDLVAAACGGVRRTHANAASFNNELGLPLTLLDAPDNTEVLVLEMGARGRGHIAELCEVAKPTVGVVTRVAFVHGELFGSIEAVAETKAELVQSLPADGRAVLNADDPRVAAMATQSAAPTMTYGAAASADVRLGSVRLDALLRPTFEVTTATGSVEISLPISGDHMAHNAAGAVAAALSVGVSLEDAAAGLAATELSAWRMDVQTAAAGGVVVNDAYNANPTSMLAALDGLLELRRNGTADRLVATLGEMAELGGDADELHRDIAEQFLAANVEVVAVGAAQYGDGVRHVADIEAAVAAVGPTSPGTAVLVKASRVAELERLAARLVDGGPSSTATGAGQ